MKKSFHMTNKHVHRVERKKFPIKRLPNEIHDVINVF